MARFDFLSGTFLGVFLLLGNFSPAHAQQVTLAQDALEAAVDMFESALPALPPSMFGVDLATYQDALSRQRFLSPEWGDIIISVSRTDEADGSCRRFAAYTEIPPRNGTVRLVLCPQFFSPGADGLRRLTILHEVVHAVAGPDECRAMAFAAAVEHAATGRFTAVDRYWQANGCPRSPFSLP